MSNRHMISLRKKDFATVACMIDEGWQLRSDDFPSLAGRVCVAVPLSCPRLYCAAAYSLITAEQGARQGKKGGSTGEDIPQCTVEKN